MHYSTLLSEKIGLQRRIQLLAPNVSHYDLVQNTAAARELRRLRTDLNYTEDALNLLKVAPN